MKNKEDLKEAILFNNTFTKHKIYLKKRKRKENKKQNKTK